jgi:glycosyltransferase involved in cell wall biosynthesis
MRILLINSEYPPIGGGAGNASEHLAREMAAQGHQVTVLTSRFKGLPHRESQGSIYIHRVPALRRRQDRSKAYEQIAFILTGSLAALPLAARLRPDVTLAFFGMPSGAIGLLLRIMLRIPYVVSLRGGDVPGFRPYDFAFYHRLISPLLHLIWRHAQAVVANSGGLRALAQRFNRRVPIHIIPNGADLEVFSPPEREWSPPRLLFVGRVVYQKGLDLLLHALSNLRHIPWELTVVGDGPQRRPLKQLCEHLGIEGRVRFLGWLKGPALVDAYGAANLFPYPSRHEGMPNAVLEAMASGLPVIASRIAGNEELVIPEETGLLIEPENQQALERALARLIEDPHRRREMGQAARRRAAEHFPWSKMAGMYLDLLARVVRRVSAGARRGAD